MWSMVVGSTKKVGGQLIGLHKVCKCHNIILQQVAFISHREKRLDLPPKKPPYPYMRKEIKHFFGIFDYPLDRFDENTKLIVVDGPIAAGKDKFCKQLAAEFDMKYLPPLTFDDIYAANAYGTDLRDYDEHLPLSLQSHDLKKYLKQPFHVNTSTFQIDYYRLKYDRYCDALIHLISTGDGVIIQRSPYSDFVFVDAMVKAGYMSKEAQSYYYDMTLRTLHLLLKPHVVIYLDVDAKTTLENIKKRGNPDEVNSKVFTLEYLQDIENNYKKRYLQKMEPYCHILNYKWSDVADFDFVIEDLEALHFEYQQKDTKMEDWNTMEGYLWIKRRKMYSPFKRDALLYRLMIPRIDVDELMVSGEDCEVYDHVLNTIPGYRYDVGYDPKLDGNLFFKTKDALPLATLRAPKTIEQDMEILQIK